MKDVHTDMNLVLAHLAVLSADPTPINIDLQGYEAAEIIIAVGIGGITFTGTNRLDIAVRHGDTSTVGNHVAVAQDDILGATVASGGIVKSFVAEHAAAAVYRVGYKGNRRHLSILPDFGGTHGAGTPICIMVARMEGHVNPQANQI